MKRSEGEGVGPREDNRERERGKEKRKAAKNYREIEEKIIEGDELEGREQTRKKAIDFIFIIPNKYITMPYIGSSYNYHTTTPTQSNNYPLPLFTHN